MYSGREGAEADFSTPRCVNPIYNTIYCLFPSFLRAGGPEQIAPPLSLFYKICLHPEARLTCPLTRAGQ